MSTDQSADANSPAPAQATTTADIPPEVMTAFHQQLVREQKPALGLSLGVVAMLVGTLVWVLIVVTTKYKVGYVAIGIGFLVGYSIQRFGRNIDKKYAIAGGALALLGCALGNLIAACAIAAEETKASVFAIASQINFGNIIPILTETFSPMDALFYGLAAWAGYKYAFRPVTLAEVEAFQASRAH